MSGSEDSDPLGRVHLCDIRLLRERAREEWRQGRQADTERARRTHTEMAEHYEMVAELLEAKAGLARPTPGPSLRRMLTRLLPR